MPAVTLRFLVLALAMLAVAGTSASADVAAFYRGKTLRILVGYGPGTGYDVYARLLGRHIVKHIPGQPTIVIQNMPGASGLTMVNNVYNLAPRDGTAIGVPARWLFVEPLYGNENARFDSRKFTWLGSMSRDASVCLTWHTSGIASIEDAKRREVLVGSSGVNSMSYLFPQLLNAELGTRLKPVLGYPDSGAVGIAMERGEIDGYCSFTWGSIKSARPQWIEKKRITLLAQLTLRKHPDLPNVPLVMDLAKNEAAREAFALAFGDQEMARPVFAPPDVPADRAAALRAAFDATMKDPEFLADAARSSIDIDPIDAAAVEQVLDRLYATPKPVIDLVKSIMVEGSSAK
jgi:tripartite-type tricarboxylate transporter receptor subunit TctC